MKKPRTAYTLKDAPEEDLDNLSDGFEDILRAEQKGIDQLEAGETVDFDEVMAKADTIIATHRERQHLVDAGLHDLADVLDELDEILGAAPKKS